VGSGVSDVILLHLVGDRLQDLEQFVAIGGAVQQGSSKVSGHGFQGVKGESIVAGKGSGCQVGRRPAGAVEGNHRFRFGKGAEELRPPLTGIVGGLVADFVADHRGWLN